MVDIKKLAEQLTDAQINKLLVEKEKQKQIFAIQKEIALLQAKIRKIQKSKRWPTPTIKSKKEQVSQGVSVPAIRPEVIKIMEAAVEPMTISDIKQKLIESGLTEKDHDLAKKIHRILQDEKQFEKVAKGTYKLKK